MHKEGSCQLSYMLVGMGPFNKLPTKPRTLMLWATECAGSLCKLVLKVQLGRTGILIQLMWGHKYTC